jgi:D-tyrosyl-tRNA(Tyr) deacylase
MRVVVQRVRNAQVDIPATGYSASIGHGLLLLAAFIDEDTEEDLDWTARKIAAMRIFDDENGVMNRSVKDIDGEVLVVSQFTLYAATKKGNRPSYIRAAGHATAIPMYEKFCKEIETLTGKEVKQGEFGADMLVSLENSRPVTIVIDSKNRE